VPDHLDRRVHPSHRLGRRLGLQPADVGVRVDDLALQVARLDHVRVDDPEGPDAGRGEVEERRRPEATGADDEDPGRGQPLLPLPAHLREKHVARIPLHGRAVQGAPGRRDRRERHAPTVPPTPGREAYRCVG
jgi:hypothetical protein